MQATLSIASSEHQFTGHTTQHQKALWLTDDEDVDHGYVVADITHKLHQQVVPGHKQGLGGGGGGCQTSEQISQIEAEAP
jgi:hypothetical protein